MLQAIRRRAIQDRGTAASDASKSDVSDWCDHLAAQAAEFRRCGFSAVLLPRVAQGDDFDHLRRLVSILHACGLDVYADGAPVGTGALDGVVALTRALGVQGVLVEGVIGLPPQSLGQVLDLESREHTFVVGEYVSADPLALRSWVWSEVIGGRCSVLDLPLQRVLQEMCNGASTWRMGTLQNAGYVALDPTHAVTCVETSNTDASAGEKVIKNKLLGYAFILTAEGYPSVLYRDYSLDPGDYGLKPFIDNLVWIHECLAFGASLVRLANDSKAYVFERMGAPGLLVGLNSDQADNYTANVQTSFGAGVRLHDYSGNHPDVWTDAQGRIGIELPRNIDGRGYVCFSKVGLDREFAIERRTTTQAFWGIAGPDAKSLVNGRTVTIARVWCQAATALTVRFLPDMVAWRGHTAIVLDVLEAGGTVLASRAYVTGSTTAFLVAVVKHSGWVMVRATGHELPNAVMAYELTVTYSGMQGL